MSTESTTKPAAPLQCRGCGESDGPFTKKGFCEDCEPAGQLRSALQDGGHLDGNATALMNNYAADVLTNAADLLRTAPGCENAARIVDSLAAGRTA